MRNAKCYKAVDAILVNHDILQAGLNAVDAIKLPKYTYVSEVITYMYEQLELSCSRIAAILSNKRCIDKAIVYAVICKVGVKRRPRGGANYCSLTAKQVKDLRQTYAAKIADPYSLPTYTDIGDEYGISRSTVQKVLKGKSYKSA